MAQSPDPEYSQNSYIYGFLQYQHFDKAELN